MMHDAGTFVSPNDLKAKCLDCCLARSCDKASLALQAVWTSPEKIKPKALTRMLQDWIDDCHNQTALASGVDAYARKIYEVCRGCAGPNSACCQILASRVEEYAEKIYEVCHGHAGLTGACCQRLKMEAEAALNKQEQYSLTKFDDFLTWSMPAILSGIPVYSRLLEEIKTKPSFAQLADLSQVYSQRSHSPQNGLTMQKLTLDI